MRFALVDNKRHEAAPNLRGICYGCSQPVIPKCGTRRIHHWAHSNNRVCDNWWEPETEWHRSWKQNFPGRWQEFFLLDELTGEKHIADVRTDNGLVIEFQHSYLDPQERTAREKFYKDMVWIVDGLRLKKDLSRFRKGMKYFQPVKKDIFHIDFPEECFSPTWLESSVPVIFDFKDAELTEASSDMKNNLYCLFPVRVGGSVTLVRLSRKTFINAIISEEWISRTHRFIDNLNQDEQKWQSQDAIRHRRESELNDTIWKIYYHWKI